MQSLLEEALRESKASTQYSGLLVMLQSACAAQQLVLSRRQAREHPVPTSGKHGDGQGGGKVEELFISFLSS